MNCRFGRTISRRGAPSRCKRKPGPKTGSGGGMGLLGPGKRLLGLYLNEGQKIEHKERIRKNLEERILKDIENERIFQYHKGIANRYSNEVRKAEARPRGETLKEVQFEQSLGYHNRPIQPRAFL